MRSQEDLFDLGGSGGIGQQVGRLVLLGEVYTGLFRVALGVELPGVLVERGGGGGGRQEVVVALHAGAHLRPHGLQCPDLLVLLIDVEGTQVEPPQRETSQQQCTL